MNIFRLDHLQNRKNADHVARPLKKQKRGMVAAILLVIPAIAGAAFLYGKALESAGLVEHTLIVRDRSVTVLRSRA